MATIPATSGNPNNNGGAIIGIGRSRDKLADLPLGTFLPEITNPNNNYDELPDSLTINAIHNDILFDLDGSTTYTGNAIPGSLTSASVWTIKQTVYDSGGAVVTNLTATNVAWDDRLTETYS